MLGYRLQTRAKINRIPRRGDRRQVQYHVRVKTNCPRQRFQHILNRRQIAPKIV